MQTDTSLFCKVDRFFGPSSARTVQNSLNNVGGSMPLAQDCPAPMIDSITGHYNSTGTHNTCTSLWLAFFDCEHQGRALDRAFVVLNGMSMHCHAYRKRTGGLRSRDTLYSGHFGWHQWCPHYRGSSVHYLWDFLIDMLYTKKAARIWQDHTMTKW